MTKWTDVYARTAFNDDGTYPRQATSSSPDIIPYGINPAENPDDLFVINNWDKDLGKTLDARILNYLYFRVANLSDKKQTGKLYLYYSRASMLLYPNFWENNVLRTQDGKDYYEFEVDKNGKIVSGTDNKQGTFVWKPEMITDDHYCLVGRIVTLEHPNPVPKTGDIDDFASFISTNPNYAWRNVTVIDRNSPTASIDVHYDEGNLDAEIYFMLTCKNLPIGSEVMFSCPTTGPEPLIHMEKTKITNPQNQVFGVKCHVPSNFVGDITYSYWANGLKPSKDFSITLEAIYIPNENSRLHELGVCKPLHTFGLQDEPAANGIGPKVGVRVGQHRMESKKEE